AAPWVAATSSRASVLVRSASAEHHARLPRLSATSRYSNSSVGPRRRRKLKRAPYDLPSRSSSASRMTSKRGSMRLACAVRKFHSQRATSGYVPPENTAAILAPEDRDDHLPRLRPCALQAVAGLGPRRPRRAFEL